MIQQSTTIINITNIKGLIDKTVLTTIGSGYGSYIKPLEVSKEREFS